MPRAGGGAVLTVHDVDLRLVAELPNLPAATEWKGRAEGTCGLGVDAGHINLSRLPQPASPAVARDER